MCTKALRSTCVGMFGYRSGGRIDDRYIPLSPPLPGLVDIERIFGGGKSGAVVLLVTRKEDKKPRTKYVLKVYLNAYNQFGEVGNERPFREVYSQCMLNGNRGYNCTACLGKAPWPAQWVTPPPPILSKRKAVIDERFVLPRQYVLFMMTALSPGVALTDVDINMYGPWLPGLCLEIWAVWQRARRVLGPTTFSHGDYHSDNIMVDFETPRRKAIEIGGRTIHFPRVTVIDFDLVQSDIFPTQLEEHKAKASSKLQLTERTLQWTIKWLPPAVLARWLTFIATAQLSGSQWHLDYGHLFTYTLVCILYYLKSERPERSVEEIFVQLLHHMEQAWEHLTSSVGHVESFIKLVADHRKIRGGLPHRLLPQMDPAMFLSDATVVFLQVGGLVLNHNNLLSPQSLSTHSTGGATITLRGLSSRVGEWLKSPALGEGITVPQVFHNWDIVWQEAQQNAIDAYFQYVEDVGSYPTPDDMRFRVYGESNLYANMDESQMPGLAITNLVIHGWKVPAAFFVHIDMLDLRVRLDKLIPKISLKTNLTLHSNLFSGYLSAKAAEWLSVVPSALRSWWRKGDNNEKTKAAPPHTTNADFQFRLTQERLMEYESNVPGSVPIMTVETIEIDLDAPTTIRIYVNMLLTGVLESVLFGFLSHIVILLVRRFTGLDIESQRELFRIDRDMDNTKIVIEATLVGDPHPCIQAIQGDWSGALDCMSFVSALMTPADTHIDTDTLVRYLHTVFSEFNVYLELADAVTTELAALVTMNDGLLVEPPPLGPLN